MNNLDLILAGGGALIAASIMVRNPTPRLWQLRIIQLRAVALTLPLAWRAAAAAWRYEWPESVRRAKLDV